MNVQTTLNFYGRTEEAVKFYCRTIEAETLFMMRFRDCPDPSQLRPGIEEQIFHATFRIGSTVMGARQNSNHYHSQRIPKDELPAITRAVDGSQRFVHLSDEFAALTETLTQRSGPLLPSKKNSRKPLPTKNTAKPKPS